MTRPLLSLVMIVKDEAKTIRRTLESAKAHVDCWTVLDTGSTDATRDIVREVMSSLPGALYEEPFVDYATSRNRALELDKGGLDERSKVLTMNSPAVFTLMLSADEVLEGGDALRSFLELHREGKCGDGFCPCSKVDADGAYCVTMRTDSRQWPYTRVLRTDGGWRYVGEIQERPASPSGETRAATIPGVRVIHTESDPERKRRRLREVDLPILSRQVADESKSLLERAHPIFFLAETYAVLAEDEDDEPGSERVSLLYAAMANYWRYASIAESEGGAQDFDKAMYAYAMHYHLAQKARVYTNHEMVVRLETLCGAAPDQAEARYMLAAAAAGIDARQGLMRALQAADCAKRVLAKPPLTVPVDTRLEWLSLQLAAACAEQLKDHDRAKKIADKAIAAGCPAEAIQFKPTERVMPKVNGTPEVGRNQPCPCGSGKKYKVCCLEKETRT